MRAVARQLVGAPLRDSYSVRGVYSVFPAQPPPVPAGGASALAVGAHTDGHAGMVGAMILASDVPPRCGGFTVPCPCLPAVPEPLPCAAAADGLVGVRAPSNPLLPRAVQVWPGSHARLHRCWHFAFNPSHAANGGRDEPLYEHLLAEVKRDTAPVEVSGQRGREGNNSAEPRIVGALAR